MGSPDGPFDSCNDGKPVDFFLVWRLGEEVGTVLASPDGAIVGIGLGSLGGSFDSYNEGKSEDFLLGS